MEKLAAMAQDLIWHDASPMLAAVMDGKFTTWLYPRCVPVRCGGPLCSPLPRVLPFFQLTCAASRLHRTVFMDRELLSRTRYEREATEFGQNPRVLSFSGSFCAVRRADGATMMATSVGSGFE